MGQGCNYIKELDYARVSSFLTTLTFGTGLVVNVSLFLFLVFRGGESVRSTTESLLLSLSDHMVFSGNFHKALQCRVWLKYNKYKAQK